MKVTYRYNDIETLLKEQSVLTEIYIQNNVIIKGYEIIITDSVYILTFDLK